MLNLNSWYDALNGVLSIKSKKGSLGSALAEAGEFSCRSTRGNEHAAGEPVECLEANEARVDTCNLATCLIRTMAIGAGLRSRGQPGFIEKRL